MAARLFEDLPEPRLLREVLRTGTLCCQMALFQPNNIIEEDS